MRERYHGLLLRFDGHPCPDIARWLSRDDDTIRSWVAAFNEAGLEGLQRAPIPGRPT
ncbi:MAG TPA: helix-turn-helix domain-containing protein [Candidatus Tectomicrobia bacterium]